jgi:hypothetical protein
MTTPQNPDADLLDSLIGSHANPWYGRGCSVGRMIFDLEPGEFRTRLVAYMALPQAQLGHAAIIAAISETIGVELRSDTLARHRRRACSCPDVVFS